MRLGIVALGCLFTLPARSEEPMPSPSVPKDHWLVKLREKAEGGDALAQYLLGGVFEVANHPEVAAGWYRKAAEQGNALAQGSLGRLCWAGEGVPEDYQQAYRWSLAAATKGDPLGASTLGGIYLGGNGRPKDAGEAAKWLRHAALADCERKQRPKFFCARAQGALSRLYLTGEGVPQDYVQAHMWANLSAAGLDGTDDFRKISLETRDAAAALMTPDQIADAQRLARDWRPSEPE